MGIIYAKSGKIVRHALMIVVYVLIRPYVVMPHVMVLKHVVLVRVIVEIARHLIPIVEMDHVNTIIMRIVCYVQKIVGRVHHRILCVVTAHVMAQRIVILVQLTVEYASHHVVMEFVEMYHKKHVQHVLLIVGYVIPIVVMVFAKLLWEKIVIHAQVIVVHVQQLVEIVYVNLKKAVVHVQAIVGRVPIAEMAFVKIL